MISKSLLRLAVEANPALLAHSRRLAVDASVLTDLKRGGGGRSSFSGVVATVFGASGLLGSQVVSYLGRTGAQIIVPYRGDPYFVKNLKLCGDLGQVLFVPFDLRDEASIHKSMSQSNVVINCIGQMQPNKLDFFYKDTHVDGAERLARISSELGVDRFIHVSALTQTKEVASESKPNLSAYMNTKAEGEERVLKHRPDATIFRPANMWGHFDNFLTHLCSTSRRTNIGNRMLIYLKDKGVNSIKQPVHYSNVADGIVRAVGSPLTAGHIYEAVGPHRYRMDDLFLWVYLAMQYLPYEVVISDSLIVKRLNQIRCSEEILYRDSLSDNLSGCGTLEDLGVNLIKLEDRIHHYLYRRRRYREYWDAVGEFPDPPNPPIQNIEKTVVR